MKTITRILTVLMALVIGLALAACTSAAEQEKIMIGSLADLEGKTIGVQMGTIGDDLASKDAKAGKVERYNQYVDAITSLKQKKIDAIIMDRDTADAYLKANSDLALLDVGFEPEQYAVAVQKGDSDLLKAVNDVIAEMKADGSLAESIKSHEELQGKAPDYNKGASGGVLIVGTESGFPPYEYMSGNDIIGIDVDIMARVAKKLNMELKMEDMPFDGLIAALTSGKINAIAAGLTVNEERKVNVDFSEPYVDASQVVVLRKTSLK